MNVTSDLPPPPPLRPMPPGRVQVRRLALIREIDVSRRAQSSLARWRVAIPVAAVVAIAGVFAAGINHPNRVSLTATWTPIPTTVGGDKAATLYQQCQQELLKKHWPIKVTTMSGVLAEQRGKLTAVLMTSADQYGMCVGDQRNSLFDGVGVVEPFNPADLLVLDGNPGQLNGAGAFRVAYGQVAPRVASVAIETVDGQNVDATVLGGRFFAWWPSGADPSTISAIAADGSQLDVLKPTSTGLSSTPLPKPIHP
jgi:hypothetical protein